VIELKELLDAGVHFGHPVNRWNPKMARYIYGERSHIYIIDLKKTVRKFNEAFNVVRDLVAAGGSILFVGTKRQAQPVIEAGANRCNMFYVNQRWLGGMLTNFTTIRKSVDRLAKLEKFRDDGMYDRLPKKEVMQLEKEREKLNRNLSGIRHLNRLPSAVFVVDILKERICVAEARRLNIPVIAVVDTNCDPDEVDYMIPGNDDGVRSIGLITEQIVEAVLEGTKLRTSVPPPPAASPVEIPIKTIPEAAPPSSVQAVAPVAPPEGL